MKRTEVLQRMQINLPLEKQIRVIIASDVKNEADDQFAVVHQLLTPIFDVRGIIASHFESKAPGTCTTMQKSYYELKRLMTAAEIDDVQMLQGCKEPLKNEKDKPICDGVKFIIDEALRDDNRRLYITVQGTLTDVAAALNRCPEIAEHMTIVWIGGGAYPEGGGDFNMLQDIIAARIVFASSVELWQIPVSTYGTAEITMAEIAYKIRPYGKIGKYLYKEMEEYNKENDEPYALRKGENWNFGDSPVIAALLEADWRGNFHMEQAPYICDDMTYRNNSGGKMIRVYDYVDIRMLMEDFFAKLALCYGN